MLMTLSRDVAPRVTAKLDFKEAQFGRARDGLERYLLVRPGDAEGYYLMGEAYRRENPNGDNFDKAFENYQLAVAMNWRLAEAHREIGMAHRMLGNTEQARDAFERYLRVAPDAPDAGIVRGYLEGLE